MSELSDLRNSWVTRLEEKRDLGLALLAIHYEGDPPEPFLNQTMLDAFVELDPDRETLILAVASTIAKAQLEGLADRGLYFRRCIENMQTAPAFPEVAPAPRIFAPAPRRRGWLGVEFLTEFAPQWMFRKYPVPGFPEDHSKLHAVYDITDNLWVTACGVEWDSSARLEAASVVEEVDACKSCIAALERAGVDPNVVYCTCELSGACEACRTYAPG